MTIKARQVISSSHRLINDSCSDEWNEKVYGKCFLSEHGHSFVVEVEIDGDVDAQTGMVVNFTCLKDVIDKFDHKRLNDMMGSVIPTAENLVTRLIKDIRKLGDFDRVFVEVWESEDCSAHDEWESERVR